MAEYIDRRRLFNALADYWNIPHDWDGGIAQPCEDALAFIENAPEEDVAPVVHGRWESLTECANAGVYCSVCNKKVYKEDYAWSNKRIKMRSNYCPNCGAKMDLEGGDGA